MLPLLAKIDSRNDKEASSSSLHVESNSSNDIFLIEVFQFHDESVLFLPTAAGLSYLDWDVFNAFC